MRRRDFIAVAATLTAAPAIVEDAVAGAAAGDERGEVHEPRPPPGAPLYIIVNTHRQRLFVLRGDEVIASTRVSTGRRATPTPLGTFPILEKHAEHYSNLYGYAPMHYMQRLTWDGVTLHAGRATGRPRSHGCVVMPTSFARALFAVTRIGTRVVVE